MVTEFNDHAFRTELLEVFALEAQEWLQQGRAALLLLQRQPGLGTNFKFLDIIQQGMWNLGGSAATVDLPRVSELAYGVLPILDSRQRQERSTPEDWAYIQELLEEISSAIEQITAEKPSGAVEDQARSVEGTTEPPSSPVAAEESITLDALCQLQLRLAQSGQTGRNLVDLVLQRARNENGQGGDQPIGIYFWGGPAATPSRSPNSSL